MPDVITPDQKAAFRKAFPEIPKFNKKEDFVAWLDEHASVRQALAKAELHQDPWDLLAPEESIIASQAVDAANKHGKKDTDAHGLHVAHDEEAAPNEETYTALQNDEHYKNMIQHAVNDWNEQNPNDIIKNVFIKDAYGNEVINPEIVGSQEAPGKIPDIQRWAYENYKEAYGQHAISAVVRGEKIKAYKKADQDPAYRKLLETINRDPANKQFYIDNFFDRYPTKAYEYKARHKFPKGSKEYVELEAAWKRYKARQADNERRRVAEHKIKEKQRKQWDKDFKQIRRKDPNAIHQGVAAFNNEVSNAVNAEIEEQIKKGHRVDKRQLAEEIRRKRVEKLFEEDLERAHYLVKWDKTLKKEHDAWKKAKDTGGISLHLPLLSFYRKKRIDTTALRESAKAEVTENEEIKKDAQVLGHKDNLFTELKRAFGRYKTPNRITGMVLTNGGQPLQGAALKLTSATNEVWTKNATTRKNGLFGFSVPYGAFNLSVSYGNALKEHKVSFKQGQSNNKTLLIRLATQGADQKEQAGSKEAGEKTTEVLSHDEYVQAPINKTQRKELSSNAPLEVSQTHPEEPLTEPESKQKPQSQKRSLFRSSADTERPHLPSTVDSFINKRPLSRFSKTLDSGISNARRGLRNNISKGVRDLSSRRNNRLGSQLAQNLIQIAANNPWGIATKVYITVGILLVLMAIVLILAVLNLFFLGDDESPVTPTPTPSVTPLPELTITKVGPENVANNEEVTYSISLTYLGPATTLTVTDVIHGKAELVKDKTSPIPTDTKLNSDGTLRSVMWEIPAKGSVTQATIQAEEACVGAPKEGWDNINEYDPLFIEASNEFGVPADLLKAMAMIESGGVGHDIPPRDDGFGDGLSYGLMQVKPNIHHSLLDMSVDEATEHVKTPKGNIRMAAAILADAYKQHGSWEDAILMVYFPKDDPNGTSQTDYINTVDQYRSELKSAGCDTDETPPNDMPTDGPTSTTITLVVKPTAKNSYLYNSARVEAGEASTQPSPGNPPSNEPPPADVQELKDKLCNDYNICPTISTESPPAGDWTKDSLTALWNVIQRMASSPTYMNYVTGDQKLEISRVHSHPDDGGWAYGVHLDNRSPSYNTIDGSRLIIITDRAFQSFGGSPSIPYLEWLLAHEIAHASSYGTKDGGNGHQPGNPVYQDVINCGEIVSSYGSQYGPDENYADAVSFYLTTGEDVVNYFGESYNLKQDFPCTYEVLRKGYFNNNEF
jgi:hypothetical protein